MASLATKQVEEQRKWQRAQWEEDEEEEEKEWAAVEEEQRQLRQRLRQQLLPQWQQWQQQREQRQEPDWLDAALGVASVAMVAAAAATEVEEEVARAPEVQKAAANAKAVAATARTAVGEVVALLKVLAVLVVLAALAALTQAGAWVVGAAIETLHGLLRVGLLLFEHVAEALTPHAARLLGIPEAALEERYPVAALLTGCILWGSVAAAVAGWVAWRVLRQYATCARVAVVVTVLVWGGGVAAAHVYLDSPTSAGFLVCVVGLLVIDWQAIRRQGDGGRVNLEAGLRCLLAVVLVLGGAALLAPTLAFRWGVWAWEWAAVAAAPQLGHLLGVPEAAMAEGSFVTAALTACCVGGGVAGVAAATALCWRCWGVVRLLVAPLLVGGTGWLVLCHVLSPTLSAWVAGMAAVVAAVVFWPESPVPPRHTQAAWS